MPLLITILAIVVGVILYSVYSSAQERKRREEIVERRKQYVEKLGSSVRIIVNNGNIRNFV